MNTTNALPSGSGKGNLSLSGNLDLNGQTTTSLNGLSGAGTIDNNAGVGTYALSVGNNDQTSTFGGVIQNTTGTLDLTKTGTGTLTLSNTSTYTGATNVSAGTLVVNGNISTSITTVASGGTLGGSGTVGALTVLNGGTHAPGTSPSIQNTGNYSNAGTLGIEIDGSAVGTGYDQVNVTGTVALSGLLSITMGYTPAVNELFFILANNDSDPIAGTLFSNAPIDGNTYTLGGQQFQISYFGNQTSPGVGTFTGGNDVVLMAIPEPNVAALLGSLGILALLRRRRN
jgi:autotransporter-associated beta strand protein